VEQLVEILKTNDFLDWFDEQQEKTKLLIDARFDRIAYFGHFGTMNRIAGIIELKWKSGMRIYTHRIDKNTLIVLLGGTKHGQKRDINKAKRLLGQILE
jgi:putative addiction module killer protein